MATLTLVARAVDGLILAESQDIPRGGANGQLASCKPQAMQLLTKLHSMPPQCSLFDSYGGSGAFHFSICDGICYLAIFDKTYPATLAFSYLDEIRLLFVEELKVAFGTGSFVDHRSHVDTLDRPYIFARFDRQMSKKNAEFQDPSSSFCIGRLYSLSTNQSWHSLQEVIGSTGVGNFEGRTSSSSKPNASVMSRVRAPDKIAWLAVMFCVLSLFTVLIGCNYVARFQRYILIGLALMMLCGILLLRPRTSQIPHTKADVLAFISDCSDHLI